MRTQRDVAPQSGSKSLVADFTLFWELRIVIDSVYQPMAREPYRVLVL
ncbi:hypothetical protein IH601_00280 [Candidatus Bipolaricaulota bacterium]|nr:hypothetical protein [Candidatus Bipolaricaulota bacterium]